MATENNTDCLPNEYDPAWLEYDYAARWCAERKHFKAERLPQLMSAKVVALIEADTEAFVVRIREFAYGLAHIQREGR